MVNPWSDSWDHMRRGRSDPRALWSAWPARLRVRSLGELNSGISRRTGAWGTGNAERSPALLPCPGTLTSSHLVGGHLASVKTHLLPCMSPPEMWPTLNVTYFLKNHQHSWENRIQHFDNHFSLKYSSIASLFKSLKGQWPLLVDAPAMGKLGEEAEGRGGWRGAVRGKARLTNLAWCPPLLALRGNRNLFPDLGSRGQKAFLNNFPAFE